MLQLKRTCNWMMSNYFILIVLMLWIRVEGRPHHAGARSEAKSLSALKSSDAIDFNSSPA